MDQITLSGVTAVGHHGVFDFERRDGQPFVVDAVLHTGFREGRSLRRRPRHRALRSTWPTVSGNWITGEPLNLIEALAVRIADDILQKFPVAAVDITVHKPKRPDRGRVRRRLRQRAPEADMSPLYTRAVIALGSNLGERSDTLSAAVADLVDPPEVRLLAISPIVQTKAVGGPAGQPDFLDMVVAVETSLPPRELLQHCHAVEQKHLRVRDVRWGPRTLDVDIITYGDVVSPDPELTLPHPRAAERAFVLYPWSLIDPAAELNGERVGDLAVKAADFADLADV